MQGFQLSFYTRADARHDHQPVGEWLLGFGGTLDP